MRSLASGLVRSLATAVALSCILPLGAVAGTIKIFDLTDTVTFTDDTGRLSGSCTGESCSWTLLPGAPQGSIFENSQTIWLEPGTTNISDEFCGGTGCSVDLTGATITFASDDEGSLGTCSICTNFENGALQTAITITWGIGFSLNGIDQEVTDTIQFQSDVSDSVPEPSSILLLLTGLAGVGLLRFRHRRTRTV